jgi:hypothetical protein
VPISLHISHLTELVSFGLVREDAGVRLLTMREVEEGGVGVPSYEVGVGVGVGGGGFGVAERMGVGGEFVRGAKMFYKRIVKGQKVL